MDGETDRQTDRQVGTNLINQSRENNNTAENCKILHGEIDSYSSVLVCLMIDRIPRHCVKSLCLQLCATILIEVAWKMVVKEKCDSKVASA